MKNKEKYFDEIIDIVPFARLAVSRKTHKPCMCNQTKCVDCLFGENRYACDIKLKKWLEEEYIDWNKVEVDTKILVSDDNKHWLKRYFAKYEDGKVYAWANGKTSWSVRNESNFTEWKCAKLCEENENEK